MAEHTENINIIYNTNASQVVKPIQNMTAQMKHQQNSVKALALRFVGYNLVLNAVMNLQRKLIDGIMESVKAFREFEVRMTEVSTIMGTDTLDQLDRLSAGVEVLSMNFGQATSDMAKGLYDILSAAFSVRDSLSLLNVATKASIAGLSDVRTSVDIFTSVLNAYGKEVSQAAIISDDLFQSVIRGKFQFAELESALGYIVPIAAQAGITFKELMSALSTATRHGLHLDMASRGLALAIQNIIQPSEGAAEAAEKYGISMDGLTLRVKGLYGWFEELNQKTKEFGRSIIGELIPNMRSVRVAMVLAGDEGLAGFAEDMELIEAAAGRTEEALSKMMETSQFVANQLTQQMEALKRDVGEGWDELVLHIQSGVITIIKAFTSLPTLLQDTFMKAPIQKGREEWVKQFMPTGDEIEDVKRHIGAINLGEEISKIMSKTKNKEVLAEMNKDLLALQSAANQTQSAFDNFQGSLQETMEEIGNLEINLLEIETRMKSLNEELNKNIVTGWGSYQKTIKGTLGLELEQLLIEQRLVDVQHDYEMGLKDSTYVYKVLNSDMQEAIKVLREHEEAQKQDRKETELMNIAMRQLSIQIMEIQLRGMMRRRGLTRQEERTIKKLNIEQMKLRLENMKETEQETVETYSLYQEKKQMVDEYIAKLEEENYQIRYTYDQEALDLRNHIDYQKDQLNEMVGYWDLTKVEIVDTSTEMINKLKEIFQDKEFTQILKDFGIDIEETLKNLESLRTKTITTANPTYVRTTQDVISSQARNVVTSLGGEQSPLMQVAPIRQAINQVLGIRGFQRGIHSVPETGLYKLHRGESVAPAGSQSIGGDTYQIVINMNGAVVRDENDVQRVAKSMGSALQRDLLDRKSGKSKYRLLP
jgi:TP901 family phage tail tape measure protein